MNHSSSTPATRLSKAELTLCKRSFAPGERFSFRRMPICMFRGERLIFHGDVMSFAIHQFLIAKEDQFGSPPVSAAMFANAPLLPMTTCGRADAILLTLECIEKKIPWWKFWKRQKKTSFRIHGRMLGMVAHDNEAELDAFKQADVEYALDQSAGEPS